MGINIMDFVFNPYDLKVNLNLGFAYENENQLASAISHYMRGAEYGLDSNYRNKKILISECLIRTGECFFKLGSRLASTKSVILHALSNTPKLPQIYLTLSKVYEQQQEWGECNAMCNIGIEMIDNYTRFQYDNKDKETILNNLLYQRAISNYNLGKTDKARIDLESLLRKSTLEDWMKIAVENSLKTVGHPVLYNQIGYESILDKNQIFKNNNFTSFSQCLQDVFIANLFGNNGVYVEIGSGDPFKNNNTYLLERDYGWKGISIDNDRDMVSKFNSTRNNKSLLADARLVNYSNLFKELKLETIIEYLQIDCEPPEVTLEVLYKIPFDDYKFCFITFEHDSYRSNVTKKESREYLINKGYTLLISDVSFNGKDSFEDWWVDEGTIINYVGNEVLQKLKNTQNTPKNILDVFLN